MSTSALPLIRSYRTLLKSCRSMITSSYASPSVLSTDIKPYIFSKPIHSANQKNKNIPAYATGIKIICKQFKNNIYSIIKSNDIKIEKENKLKNVINSMNMYADNLLAQSEHEV